MVKINLSIYSVIKISSSNVTLQTEIYIFFTLRFLKLCLRKLENNSLFFFPVESRNEQHINIYFFLHIAQSSPSLPSQWIETTTQSPLRRTCFAGHQARFRFLSSGEGSRRGLSRGCPASRDAISPELSGDLAANLAWIKPKKPETAGRDSIFEGGWKEVEGREGEEGGRDRISSVERKLSAVRRGEGKGNTRRWKIAGWPPDVAGYRVQRNRFHAHDAACNKCSWGRKGKIGKRGKKKKGRKRKEKKKKESVRETRKTHLRHALFPSRPLEIRWFSARLLESRWYSREGGLEEIRSVKEEFFKVCVFKNRS